MPRPSEKESSGSDPKNSNENEEKYTCRVVFKGVGHLVYTDDGVFLSIDSTPQEPPFFDRPVLGEKIGMVELFEGVSGRQRYRITVERTPENPRT